VGITQLGSTGKQQPFPKRTPVQQMAKLQGHSGGTDIIFQGLETRRKKAAETGIWLTPKRGWQTRPCFARRYGIKKEEEGRASQPTKIPDTTGKISDLNPGA